MVVYLAILTGLCFGVWPLLMNRSGLAGNVASAVFGSAVLLGVLPFAFRTGFGSMATANWTMVVSAGIIGAAGLLSFNGVLSQSTKETVGMMIVLVTVVQTMVPAITHMIYNGVSVTKLVGISLALVGAVLMTR